MSHVFVRNSSYYSPRSGVVDFPVGQTISPAEEGWVSSCGTKAIFDPGVVESFLREGALTPLPAAAEAEIAAQAAEPEPAPAPAPEPEPQTAEAPASDEEPSEADSAGEEASPPTGAAKQVRLERKPNKGRRG